MNKTKIMLVGLAVLFLILMVSDVLKSKYRQEVRKKTVFTQMVMRNLLEERENIVRSVPADGLWYNMRRLKETPDILEVQIRDQNNRAVCDLKIKVRQ